MSELLNKKNLDLKDCLSGFLVRKYIRKFYLAGFLPWELKPFSSCWNSTVTSSWHNFFNLDDITKTYSIQRQQSRQSHLHCGDQVSKWAVTVIFVHEAIVIFDMLCNDETGGHYSKPEWRRQRQIWNAHTHTHYITLHTKKVSIVELHQPNWSINILYLFKAHNLENSQGPQRFRVRSLQLPKMSKLHTLGYMLCWLCVLIC